MTIKNKMSYSNGKIYKIIGTDPNAPCYVGSTTKKYLSQRLTKHRNDYKRWKNGKRSNTKSYELFDLYGAENCKIILLESVDAKTKDELRMREQFYIDSVNCNNQCNAIRTKEMKADKNNVIFHCETCNCDIRKREYTRHTKTQKHLNNISSPRTDE
jgi:hypothetical protein